MFRTILAASVLALRLSGAAMARGGHSEGHGRHGDGGHDNGEVLRPDQTVTGSIFGPRDEGAAPSYNPVRPYQTVPCASDAFQQNGSPNVNDHYCGK